MELLFVNDVGLPFNSGTVASFLIIACVFYFAISYTSKRNLVTGNTIALCILFIFLGFSSWIMLPIRANSKVVVRIFDFNGNVVTSLLEKYYENSGTIKRIEDNSEWDGRNHLGQIVPPGTYLMHIETTNILSGQSSYDVAPIVVGVY